jgi:hypothetical protein
VLPYPRREYRAVSPVSIGMAPRTSSSGEKKGETEFGEMCRGPVAASWFTSTRLCAASSSATFDDHAGIGEGDSYGTSRANIMPGAEGMSAALAEAVSSRMFRVATPCDGYWETEYAPSGGVAVRSVISLLPERRPIQKPWNCVDLSETESNPPEVMVAALLETSVVTVSAREWILLTVEY